MEGNSVTDSRSANYGAKPERTDGGSLQLSEEMRSLVLAPETGNSFTALLELPPNQARELLHAQGNDDAPAYRLLHPLNCTPTFPSNAALLERAAVFSVFAAENSQETSSIRGNSVGNSGEKVKQEPVDTDSNPNSSDLNGNQKSTKRKEREKKGKGLTKKSKSMANETSDDGEKLPYVHVRARRGQATDSHSLAERARREKINARMKLLQELVPGCNKISGTAMVLDEIINHVQSLQRQVELLSMRLAAVNPRIDFNLDSILAAESESPVDNNFPSMVMPLMWPDVQVNGNRQQYQQMWHFDGLHQPVWERESHNIINADHSLLSYDSPTNSVSLLSNQLKMEL